MKNDFYLNTLLEMAIPYDIFSMLALSTESFLAPTFF